MKKLSGNYNNWLLYIYLYKLNTFKKGETMFEILYFSFITIIILIVISVKIIHIKNVSKENNLSFSNSIGFDERIAMGIGQPPKI